MSRTRNFADVIQKELAINAELAAAVEEESFNAEIAQQVYDLRKAAGLTQKQLAEYVGTQQSVICRIEDSDYDGHSLGLLQRIADTLGKRCRVVFDDKWESPDIFLSDIFSLPENKPLHWQTQLFENVINDCRENAGAVSA